MNLIQLSLKLDLNTTILSSGMDDTKEVRLGFYGLIQYLCVDIQLDFDVCNYLSDLEACG